MKRKVIIISLLAIIIAGCNNQTNKSSQSSTRTITMQLNGKKYDQLIFRVDVGGPNHSMSAKFFPGKTNDGHKWAFSIPDSIDAVAENYVLLFRPFDLNTNTLYCVKFKGIAANDRSHYNYVFDEKNPNVEATYLETSERKGVRGDGGYFMVNDTTIIDGLSRSEDLFKVDFKGKDTELELSMKFRSFSFLDMADYKTSLAEKDSISRKYPDSNYLMNMFNEMVRDFKSIDDAKKIFYNFSERNRTSGCGKSIGSYIKLYTSAFENVSLTNTASGLLEPIILDSTKFNLLVFSASWCGHCHKLIPMLKDVYNDLNDNLNMVYISVDEYKANIDNWKKLMKDNGIPWRSLFSTGHVKDIEDKYDAHGIPHALLVYPDKSVEKIDLRIKEDKEKLYRLVQQKRSN